VLKARGFKPKIFDKLANFLDDLALSVIKDIPLKPKAIQVQDKSTKKIYPSLRSAARALNTHKTGISREMKRSDGWLKESTKIF
jgi:hypothetical protein